MYWWVQKVPTVRERGRGDEGAGARARWAKARWARARGRGRGGEGAGARVRWWVRRAARAPCSTASGSRDSQGCARSGTRASGKTRHETGRASAGVPPCAAPRRTPRRGKSTRLRCMCEESARAFSQLVAANHQAARETRGPEQHKLPASALCGYGTHSLEHAMCGNGAGCSCVAYSSGRRAHSPENVTLPVEGSDLVWISPLAWLGNATVLCIFVMSTGVCHHMGTLRHMRHLSTSCEAGRE
eukprot:scaffold6802_cov64-Phaeocystis_antarctica.AAC.5